MASDSLVVGDEEVFSNSQQKIYRLSNGALVGFAGDADCREVRDTLDKIKGKSFPKLKTLALLYISFDALLVYPDGEVYFICCHKLKEEERWIAEILKIDEEYMAIGSGRNWALGAMAQGASAKKAVQIASLFDVNTGGKIQTFNLEVSVE